MDKKIDLKLPPGIKEAYEGSLGAIIGYEDAINRLTKELKREAETIERQARSTGKVVVSRALGLVEVARNLLSCCRQDTLAKHVPYSLAAIDYLVSEIDANPDFESYEGFDDDRRVFETIAQEFNLDIGIVLKKAA